MRSLNKEEIDSLAEVLKRKKLTKLRVAIYARKSAEDERQTSLNTQIAQCREFIKQYDILSIEYEFHEDNVSGMFTEGRKQYLKMMDLAEQGLIDVIVVMKLDRLARDLADATTTIKLLRQYKCMLIAGDDATYNKTPAGEFMRNILLAQNQYHARRTASDVITVQCNNARKGLTAGGVPPYGLKIVNKQYEIDETEAPAVRLIFEGIALGKSYKQVVDDVNNLGFQTRKKTRFSYATINTMLHNQKYNGTYIFNSKSTPRKARRVLIEDIDEVVNKDAIPPIISKELFDTVQEILSNRKESRARQNANPEYVLTGLLYCAKCGHTLSGDTYYGGRNKSRYRVYKHTKKQHESCKTKPINAEYIETAVEELIVKSINEYLSNTNISNSVFVRLEQYASSKVDYCKKAIQSLEQKISGYLEKAIDVNTSSRIAHEYEVKAEECMEVKDTKMKLLDQLNTQLDAYKDIKTKALKGKILTKEEVFTDFQTTRELIRCFINRIEIDDDNDNIRIILNK